MALLPYGKFLFTTSKCYITKHYVPVRSLMSRQLVFKEFGDPLNVVKIRETAVKELGDQEVLVRMLAAPVNPADINTIQGKYPVKVNLPAIAGNEGVGLVEDIGKGVQGICPGNKVIVCKSGQGTWRDYATFSKDVVRVVPDNLGVVEAATLTVNPCTAYRMLTDFKPVREGLVVIQNGANGACGQNVIQICKAWGVKNVAVVRDRPDVAELKKFLQCLGATHVLTEQELRTTTIFKDKTIEQPSLALNCVGGKSTTDLLRHMKHSGHMVTYGGMSREPVTIPTSAFIFKNLSFFGFWMTKWHEKADTAAIEKMSCDIINLMCDGELKGPVHKLVKFDNYQEAVGNALSSKGFTGCKYILDFRSYPSLPQLPHVPGDEGVGDVVEVGRRVTYVTPGQRVIFSTRQLGTWSYYGIYNEYDVHKIPPYIPLAEACMLSVAPVTAYRLLNDFRETKLCPAQSIIQTGANSPVGQSVIQICKAMGVSTLNVVASHCKYEKVKENLLSLGANYVYTLEEAEELAYCGLSFQRPTLAINCMSGRCEDLMLSLLERNGNIVHYGAAYDTYMMKRCYRPDVQFHRFYLNDWNKSTSNVEREITYKYLQELIVMGKLRAPQYESLMLHHFVYALRNTCPFEAFSTLNYVFDFTLI